MEQKNRLFLTILVIALIVAAMFTSFGQGLFALKTPQIVLPETDASHTDSSADGEDHTYQRLDVTPATVQSVIATLERTDSYYRELTVERFWGEENTSSILVQVWTDGGWTKIRRNTGSGAIRWDLVGPEEAWLWYDNSRKYLSVPADELSADLAQLVPTYETVLDLDPESITAAGYEDRGGLPCVYVQAQGEQPGYVLRFWVNVQSGLLISAETEVDGALVCRITAYNAIQSPCPNTAQFALPDGTVKHTI